MGCKRMAKNDSSSAEKLKEQIRRLEQEKADCERRLEDYSRMQDEIIFPWAGNLGKWRMNVKTGQVIPNPLKVTVLGYTMEEMNPAVYQFFTDMIHPDDYEDTMEAMRKHLRGEASAYEAQYRIRTKAGKWKWFYDRGIITEYDDEGAPVWLTGIVFDISEQKAKEEELKRLIAEKDKFFSIIAHDLKNPFSAFLGLTEIIAYEFDTLQTKEIKEFSQDLHTSANQLYKLLENLLEWARVQRGAVEYTPGEFSLYQVVQETADLTGILARNKDISVENEVPEDTSVWADKNMVRTVLRNLINNAVKFTDTRGQVRITAEPNEDGQMLVAVRDNGIGMDPETAGKIFSITESGNSSRYGTADERGTGLGLVLCKELVERNGGAIWVESSTGEGSAFSFTLPVLPSE